MTKYSRVSSDFRGGISVRLRVALAAGIAACLLAVMPLALAAGHPVRYADAHEAVAHRVRARRMYVQAAPESGASKTPKPNRKPGKAKAGAANATHAAKPRHHKLRPQDEADNDPLVLHRVTSRSRRSKRDVRRRVAVERRLHDDTREVADKRPLPETLMAKADVTKSVTSEDFTRAAGGDADAETFEHGQSHPEDDERLPMKQSQPIVAEVSAAPEPITPVGKATLRQKLQAAANVETAMLPGRTKASVLPEDHAGKVAVIDQAMQPMILPTLYTRHGRLIVPPPMKGTRDILIHQNTMADSEGLDRIRDDDDLDRMRDLHLLVALDDSASLRVNEGLPENRRYARPWAARFAADTARAFYSRFHRPLQLNSAVRTVEYQLRLQLTNGNAAAVDGDAASPHLTGQALDFGKRGMNRTEIAWMRAYLAPLMRAGQVDVEEEFQQACFHISVYRTYRPMMRPKAKPATKIEVARAEVPKAETTEPEER